MENTKALVAIEPQAKSTDEDCTREENTDSFMGAMELFKDQYGEGFAAITENGIRTVIAVRSRAFANHLRLLAYTRDKKILTKTKLDMYVSQCEALALFENKEHTLELRTARRGQHIFYDLGDDVVRITPNGWKVEPNQEIIFKRYSGMRKHATPITGGLLERILEFVNIKDPDDQLLFLVFIVTSFIPDIPHPILAIHGPQGSAKSSLQRFLVQLLDPWATDDVPIFDLKEFYQIISHRWVVPLDNVGKLSAIISNLACKLVTGAGFTKRKFYTDDDDVISSFKKVLIFTSIGLAVEKSDVIDRCIILLLDRIEPKHRKDEASLNKTFEELRPALLGNCFTLLSQAMKFYPDINLPEKPRLADFALWGAAVTKALGRNVDDFIRAYQKNIDRQNEESLDSSPLAAVIMTFLRTSPRLHGTPTEILKILKEVSQAAGINPRQMPKTPSSVGRALQEIKPNLEALGYFVERSRAKERRITIEPPKSLLNVDVQSNSIAGNVSSPIAATPSSPSVTSAASGTLDIAALKARHPWMSQKKGEQ